MGFSKQTSLAIFSLVLVVINYVPLANSIPDDSGFLNAHNEARKAVGVPPLQWNNTIADYAKKYANKRSADCAMEHSMGPYAENIASGKGMTGDAAVKLWCTEKDEYDYNANKCTGPESDGCYHYTQVVWKTTTQVGCARAECKNGDMFVTCNYDPSQNPEEERPY